MSVASSASEHQSLLVSMSLPRDLEREALGGADEEKKKPERSFLFLCALNGFWIPYGLIFATMGLVVLPKEAARLFPNNAAIALGGFLTIVGVTHIIGPGVGAFSDACGSTFGRRRPFVVVGSLFGIATLGLMPMASWYMFSWGYVFSFLLSMIAINVIVAAENGIIPDFVPDSQRGMASGVMGFMMLLGALIGFLCFGLSDLDFHWAYLLYAILLFLTTVLLVVVAKETPLVDNTPFTWSECRSCYSVQVFRDNPDFFWVCATRMFYYMGVSTQVFLMYFMRDQIHLTKGIDARKVTSMICFFGELTAGAVVVPTGKYSDKLGRKALVVVASLMMASTYIGFLLTPLLGTPGPATIGMYVFGAWYGLGNGCYLSVDYALALDCLPSKDNCAKDLGIWGLSYVVGFMLGPVILAPVLEFVGHTGVKNHYSTLGYVLVNVLGSLFVLLGALFLRNIRSVR